MELRLWSINVNIESFQKFIDGSKKIKSKDSVYMCKLISQKWYSSIANDPINMIINFDIQN